MNIVKQSWGFLNSLQGELVLQLIEIAGRTCYKSEDKITSNSARTFVKKLIDSGHHAMLEHGSITVKIITDRGVTHEIVRHRIASYAQESTRYCNYSKDKFGKELTVILPVEFYDTENNSYSGIMPVYHVWCNSMLSSEMNYLHMIDMGCSPQLARSVLPNSLKTEIIMTANPREWRHFFTLRCSPAAHPQMRALAIDMLKGFKQAVPVLFDDINSEVNNE